MWPKGSQASCGVLREDSGLLPRPCRKRRASSRDDGGTSWLFSSCGASVGFLTRFDGELREPLLWRQGSQVSIRVATCISWSPLTGLKGVKPPLQFGERTRNCSPGHAGKEGPHLEMTGASRGFSRAVAPVWGFSRGTTGSSGSLSCGNREVRSPWAGQGGARHCSQVRVGESGLMTG